jgi:hypothetical protein
MKSKEYRSYMQSRDKFVKSLQSEWRAAMRSDDGQAMPTRKRKAARKRFGLR